MNSITIDKLIQHFNLEVIYKPQNDNTLITKSDLNRPGIQIGGYFDKFPYERLQIIGSVEWHYISTLNISIRRERLERIFSYPIPALIVTRGLDIYPEMIEFAQKYQRTILRIDMTTTKFVSNVISYLDDMLAPQTTIHGVLVEVYGMGILILGRSGVGKSETALELIKRGHRLVADDAVEIKRIEDGILRGTAPEIIRHFMEIRGIGILDIKRLYGVGAVKRWEAIDLVVELELWNEQKEYDRLGLDEEYMDILGAKIPKLVIPVKPGRNLAMIIEVAARNNRQKQLGYNAAEELDKKLMEQFEDKSKEDK